MAQYGPQGQDYLRKRVYHAEERKELIGCKGIVKNELRPAGTMLIEGNPVDVVSEGDYIRKGSLGEVIGVNGSRVVVRQVQN